MEEEFFAIRGLLDSAGVRYEVFEHEPVYTSEDAAKIRGEPLHSGVKSLVFMTDDDFILVLVPGDRKVDVDKLRLITNKKNIHMAKPDEVFGKTHCRIGSVHPFGNLMQLKTYMERSILRNSRVNFNVGLHTMTVRMSPLDLKEIVKPEVVDVVKD